LSKNLKEIVKKIQFTRDLTVEDVAHSIGYSRVHLTKEMKKEDSPLIEILLAKYKDIDEKIAIDYEKEAMAKDLIQLKAIVRVLRGQVAKLVAKDSGQELEDVLDEQDRDTIVNIKDLANAK
jgi:hypothetical protein